MDLSLVIKFKVYSLQSILPLCKWSL
jgi:hypothetical protein